MTRTLLSFPPLEYMRPALLQICRMRAKKRSLRGGYAIVRAFRRALAFMWHSFLTRLVQYLKGLTP